MPYTPPARPSIRVIRQSPYKGGNREWSQRYFFTGSNFSLAQYNALRDALLAALDGVTLTETQVVECIGYDAGSDVPVFTSVHSRAGLLTPGTPPIMPLEVCAVVKLTTTQRTSKNHPIYGFKYFHNVQNDGGSDHEKVRASLKGSLELNMNTILAGLSDGSTTRQWCDARGAVFQARIVNPELSHRDFPNR